MEIKARRSIVHDNLLTLDHCVISGKQAQEYADAFGVKAPKEMEYPNAHRQDGKPVIGVAVHTLAEAICRQLKVDYVVQFGKGSQLRMCCKALKDANLC